MQEHLKDIGTFIFYIGLAASIYFKPKYDKWVKNRKVNLGKSVEVIKQIDNYCYYLLGILEAKRISVWQFGNGDTSFMGFSFKYTSMVGEAVRQDQAFLRNFSQKIPIYDYVPVLTDMLNNKGVFLYLKEKFKGNNVYHLLTSLDIIFCAECRLNPERLEDGMLSIAFDTEKTLSVHELEEIERVSYEIYKLLKQN